jgi:hypothetical protein
VAVAGSTLTTSDGTWGGSPAPTLAYQWQDCDSNGANCTPIPGATAASYVLGSSDVGSTVEVTVTATNDAGAASVVSAPTTVIASTPANTAAPTIAGDAVQGSTLTASVGTWSGSPPPAFSYQWQDCDATGSNCTPIAGATSATYQLVGSDVSSTIEVTVTASDDAGSSSATSAPTPVVAGSANSSS